MEQNDWTQQLRTRLDNHKTDVPDGVWDEIEQRLDATCRPRRSRRVLFAASWLTAAAAVALLLIGVFHADEASLTPVSVQRAVAEKGDAVSAEGGTPAAKLSDAPLLAVAATGLRARRVAEQNDMAAEHLTSAVPSQPESPVAKATNETEKPASKDEEPPAFKEKMVSAATPPAQSWKHPSVQSSANKASQWSIGAYACNMMSQDQNVKGSSVMVYSADTYVESDMANNEKTPPMLMADYKSVMHHNQPFSLGVSFAYSITDRLALRSGVVCTRATSDFLHTVGPDEYMERQTLHYIGVPLALNYKFWRSNSVHAYTTVGAQIDFNVKASLDTPRGEYNTNKDHPQLSGTAALGIEYDFVPQVGLYAEPGVRYYFDNNSAVENIFKANPWAFNLQLGVRINIK